MTDAPGGPLSQQASLAITHRSRFNERAVVGRKLKKHGAAKLAIMHGRMSGKQMDTIMMDFANHELDILVET